MAAQLPPIVVNLLEPLRRLMAVMEIELKTRTQEVEAAAPEELPVGLGRLTSEILEREVADWNRFKNRRQVASYTGLCPGVTGSAGHFTNLSISKHGNRRLRSVLVELAWLMVRYQPDYPPVQRWREVMASKNRPARKKAIVAVARRLAVDLWRLETGRATAGELGLRVMQPPAKQAA